MKKILVFIGFLSLILLVSCSQNEPTKYKVTFDDKNGNTEVIEVLENDSVKRPPIDPVKENFEFKGWFLDLNDEEPYKFTEKVKNNFTLYAKWEENVPEKNKYTVTFDTDGGSAVVAQEVLDGSKALKPDDPIKVGFKFIGWFLDLGSEEEFTFNE